MQWHLAVPLQLSLQYVSQAFLQIALKREMVYSSNGPGLGYNSKQGNDFLIRREIYCLQTPKTLLIRYYLCNLDEMLTCINMPAVLTFDQKTRAMRIEAIAAGISRVVMVNIFGQDVPNIPDLTKSSKCQVSECYCNNWIMVFALFV